MNRSLARRERRGAVLVLIALIISFMSVAGALLMTGAMRAAHDLSEVERARCEGEFLARAALDAGQTALETALFSGTEVPTTGEYEIADHVAPYTIEELHAPEIEQAPEGYQRFFSVYGIESAVEVDGARVVHRRIVRAHQIPLFQYAVFYEGDLRIHPGPKMVLSGPVHTNGDLWVRSSDGLVFDTNYVHSAGDIHNWCISTSVHQIEYRKWVPDPWDPSYPEEYEGAERESDFTSAGVPTGTGGFDSEFDGFDANGDGDWDDVGDYAPWELRALELWGPATGVTEEGHTVMDRSHGARPINHNGALQLEPFVETDGGDYDYDSGLDDYVAVPAGTGTYTKGALHGSADLVVTFDGTNWSVADSVGTDLTAAVSPALSKVDTFNGYADGGAGNDEPTLVIDVEALGKTGHFPENGLVYLRAPGIGPDTDVISFRLTNGSELAGAISFASEAPVYIRGDYNTVDKKPAAVMADQVCVLSNAWDDSKDASSLPNATETTYNVSVYSGETAYDAVNGVEQNGGYHNVLRYHENWSGITCHTLGSTVIPLTSKYYPTRFAGGGHFYNPPNRDFAFDPDLISDPDNLPPFTPMGVEVVVVAAN
ncbi:MAG: hypothetical protein R3F34_12070 [Planctomycetota bacterium]